MKFSFKNEKYTLQRTIINVTVIIVIFPNVCTNAKLPDTTA